MCKVPFLHQVCVIIVAVTSVSVCLPAAVECGRLWPPVSVLLVPAPHLQQKKGVFREKKKELHLLQHQHTSHLSA